VWVIVQINTHLPNGEIHAFSTKNPVVLLDGKEMFVIKHIKLVALTQVNLGEVVNSHIDDSIKINDTRDYSMHHRIAIQTVIFTGGIAIAGIVDMYRVLKSIKRNGSSNIR